MAALERARQKTLIVVKLLHHADASPPTSQVLFTGIIGNIFINVAISQYGRLAR